MHPGHDSSEGESECQIRLKSAPQWGEWEYDVVIQDTPTGWMKGDHRECVSVNDRKCVGEADQIYEWYSVKNWAKTWSVEEDHCESMKGRLFYKLDGSKGSCYSFHKRHDIKRYVDIVCRNFVNRYN